MHSLMLANNVYRSIYIWDSSDVIGVFMLCSISQLNCCMYYVQSVYMLDKVAHKYSNVHNTNLSNSFMCVVPFVYMYSCMCVYVYVYIYIYIYIHTYMHRERERERNHCDEYLYVY